MKLGFHSKTSILLLSLVGFPLFSGCLGNQSPAGNSNDRPSINAAPAQETASVPTASQAAAIITASPNPVPAGKGFGTTRISWNTGDGTVGQVYVLDGGTSEKLFADGRAQGFQDAPWIGAGATYEFRLYEGKEHKKMLASVKVTRNEK